MEPEISYPIITLCGSTKFKDTFESVAKIYTLNSFLVWMPEVWEHAGDKVDEHEKLRLNDVHRAKIKRSDSIFVINVGGYIGESTRNEIKYAESLGIPVGYYEPINKEVTE